MSKKKQLKAKLKKQYRLVLLNDQTFEERLSFKLSRLNVIVLASSALVLLVVLVSSVIVFSPLKEYIPGFADVNLRRDLNRLYIKTDSLENEINAKDLYLKTIRSIVNGDVESLNDLELEHENRDYDQIELDSIAPEDSLLRARMEEDNLDIKAGFAGEGSLFSRLNFFRPTSGFLTSKFDPGKQHFAVDIAAAEGESVKATLDGTVIQATYSIETGYVLIIQHSNNLISEYKHNSSLLKKVGTFVKAGEAIAVVGDSGEFSNGPHLHFEIWFNGTPINPEDFIRFE